MFVFLSINYPDKDTLDRFGVNTQRNGCGRVGEFTLAPASCHSSFGLNANDSFVLKQPNRHFRPQTASGA